MSQKKLKINTLALFSGGGGLDLGFSAAGFNVVLSSDIDPYSCKTLEINQGKRPFFKKHQVLCEDIRNLSKAKVNKYITEDSIDFIIGGPPCQAFSVFGKRKGLEDPRGNLVFEYARLIKEIKPQGFLFENVAGLKSIHDGKLYEELIETLSFKGEYAISTHEYEVADFGIPQFRRRVFLIGNKSGHAIPPMIGTHTPPNAMFNAHQPYNTVGKVLKGLSKPITDWSEKPKVNSHVGRNHSEEIIKRYKSLTFGERDHRTRINKLDPSRPSYTIIVGSDKGGGKGHVHPYQPREVTPRESARLQTFPDWWEFHGTGRHVIRQVGNAVPPLFATILAQHVAKHMFNRNTKSKFATMAKLLGLDFIS